MIQEIYNDSGTLLQTIEITTPNYGVTISKNNVAALNSGDLQTLVSSSSLSPGIYYKVIDVTGWDVYLLAFTNTKLAKIGYAVHQSTFTPAEVEYNLSTNFLIRVYDLTYYNWVEGTTNISQFPWGNSAFNYNKVDQFSTLILGTTSFTQFSKNLVTNGSTFNIDSATNIAAIINNKIIGGYTYLAGCYFHDFQDNTIKGDVTFVINNGGSGIIGNNEFIDLVSSMWLEGTIPNMEFNKFSKGAGILATTGNAVTVTYDISYNDIENSVINISNCIFDALSHNIIKDSTITITTGGGDYSYNTIINSEFSIDNSSTITGCEINGVKAGTGASLDSGDNYINCVYKVNEYSTFWVYYNFTNTAYFSSGVLYIQPQHQYIMGIFIASQNSSSHTISTIVGYPDSHKYRITRSSTNTLNIATGGNISFFAGSPSSPITIDSSQTDYLEFDSRPFPVGSGSSNAYLTSCMKY
jgi:hypothetical protein